MESYTNEELKVMVDDPAISSSGFRDIILRSLALKSADVNETAVRMCPLDTMLLKEIVPIFPGTENIHVQKKREWLRIWLKE